MPKEQSPLWAQNPRLDLGMAADWLRLKPFVPLGPPRALEEYDEEEEAPRVQGSELNRVAPYMFHYTTAQAAKSIREAGRIGLAKGGVWLSPTPYAAWRAVVDLGLARPCDWCLVIETAALGLLHGPALADPSDQFPETWPGGGLAFLSDTQIPARAIVLEAACEWGPPNVVDAE